MHNILPSGTILQNRYRVVRLLGQGGMGAVYLAHDQRLDKSCALKETLDVSPQAQQQFGREARFLARLDHAHLPRVTDYFAQTGRYYLVMDYVEGPDLEAWVRERGPAPPTQALAWADQVLDALDYLHRPSSKSRGAQSPPIIHRDVKPANVKVRPDGQAVLVDFGIAKEHVPGRHTMTGARAYTPGYAPLEQYTARGQTDARTDVYGLGATLYYLLTGAPPPEALDRAAGERLPSLKEANPQVQVSANVEAVVLKALNLQKQDRWQSAGEMRQALGRAARSARQPSPTPRPVPERTGRIGARQEGAAAAGAAAAAAAVKKKPARAFPLIPAMVSVAVALVLVLGLLGGGMALRSLSGRPTPMDTTIAQVADTATSVPSVAEVATVVETATLTPPEPISPATSEQPIETAPPESTLAPTFTPTSRPSLPPKATATPTRTPQPASTKPTPYPAPDLLQPDPNAELQGKPRFTWRWNPPALDENHAFDLRIWSEEEEQTGAPRRGAIAPTRKTEAEVDLQYAPAIEDGGPGIYYWTVVVVEVQPNRPPKVVGEWGEKRKFEYTEPSGPGPGPEPTATKERE